MNVDTYVNHLIGVDERVRVRFHVKSCSEITFVGKINNDDEATTGCQTIVTPAYSDVQISDMQLKSFPSFGVDKTSTSAGHESTGNITPGSVTQPTAPVDLASDSSITRDKAAVYRSMAYYLMERGEYEEARLQLQQAVEYQKEIGPGILLLLAECAAMENDDEMAYENFVTAIINIDVTIADLILWHKRILPIKYDVGGLLRFCGATLLEYAIIKKSVVEWSDDTNYCVGSLRRFLTSLDQMIHQLLFYAGTHKSNISCFLLYIISKAHGDLTGQNDGSVFDDVLRDCIVAIVNYMGGDFDRSWEVTENAIQAISEYDAQTTKYNVYGRLLCWKANLYLLDGIVRKAVPVYQSSIAALEVATDYFEPEEQSMRLDKASKGLEAALACQRSKVLPV